MKYLVDYYIYNYERQVHTISPFLSKRAGRYIERTLTIMDLDGMNFSSIMAKRDEINEIAKITSEIAENYYPGIGHKVIIVNAPFLFNMLWKVAKSFLNEKTVSRVAVYGSDFKKDLLKVIPEDQIPTFLGGKNEKPLEDGMFEDLFR